jgi:AAA domain-containing protein
VSARFAREGRGYRFAPSEAPAVLHFSRPADHRDELTFEVAVRRPDESHVLTRRVNILGSTVRGSLKELIDELAAEVRSADWKKLLREACESVLANHRAGPPLHYVRGEISRPPPPAWLSDELLLKNKPNAWIGAASTGKSTLAKATCAYYAAGYRFCERPMEQGVPLYLDWEDAEEDFDRVVYDVCRNLGAYPLPLMIWRNMRGHKLRDQIEGLARLIDKEKVGLVVLDAVAAAGGSPGEHMTWEAVALELEQCLGQLPSVTVLALDHVTAAEHKDNGQVPLKARGAERKLEFFRNQWSLVVDREAADQGRHLVSWTNTKPPSSARRARPFVTEIIHRESEISIVLRELEASSEAMQRLRSSTRLLRHFEQSEGRTAKEVCLELDGAEPSRGRLESIRTQLDRLVARSLLRKDADFRYWRRHSTEEGVLIPFPGGAD